MTKVRLILDVLHYIQSLGGRNTLEPNQIHDMVLKWEWVLSY